MASIAAASDVNPDASGRPSPVVIRVYQLQDDAAFRGVDYFVLFDDERKALGADFVSRREYVLAPAEQRKIEVELALEAKFVGVLAAYRDIRNAQWRAVVPAARKDFGIAIGRARVELTVTD
jgi:type VI secretion system protein VasD